MIVSYVSDCNICYKRKQMYVDYINQFCLWYYCACTPLEHVSRLFLFQSGSHTYVPRFGEIVPPRLSFSLIFIVLILLAHLSQRLIRELIVYPCSGVRPSVRRPSSFTISKIFFSETAGPIVLINYYTYTIYR